MMLLEKLSEQLKDRMIEWCNQQPLKEETGSTYVKGRLEKWYRFGSNLQSVRSGRDRVFACPDVPDFIAEIGNRYLPSWNSVLVCGGPTSIHWHRDHGHFLGPAVMINLGLAKYEWADRGADVNALTGMKSAELQSGDVVRIDTKCPHRSTQISAARFNITFRTIKAEFMKEFPREQTPGRDVDLDF
jgi:hypothetical protein